MHPDLEVIVQADEEARSRVALAEERSRRERNAATEGRDASIDARRKEASDALEEELRGLQAVVDMRIAELRRQQGEYLARLRDAGERQFDDAVARYLKIVCEAAS